MVMSCESADFWWIPAWEPNYLTRQLPQISPKENLFVRVRFRGVPSTAQEVIIRVWFCCLVERPTRQTQTEEHSSTVLQKPNQHKLLKVDSWRCRRIFWPRDKEPPQSHVHLSEQMMLALVQPYVAPGQKSGMVGVGGNGRRMIPHSSERSSVIWQWLFDTQPVKRNAHQLLVEGPP